MVQVALLARKSFKHTSQIKFNTNIHTSKLFWSERHQSHFNHLSRFNHRSLQKSTKTLFLLRCHAEVHNVSSTLLSLLLTPGMKEFSVPILAFHPYVSSIYGLKSGSITQFSPRGGDLMSCSCLWIF